MINSWSSEEIYKLKQLMGIMSFEKMTNQFSKRTKMSLVHKADKLGLSNNYRFRRYFFNEEFWMELNLTNCYFGGYLAADGYIDKRSIVLSLSTKDLSVLEELKKASGYTGPIRTYFRKNYKKETLKQVSTLRINTIGRWMTDLEKHFNIVPAKSLILKPPRLPNDLLIFSYLIGYLDGDGWIYLNKRGKPVLGYVNGSYDHIRWIKSFLDKYFPEGLRNESRKSKIQRQKKKGKDNNCFYFVFYGSKAAKIIDFLRQFPIFKLDRKWNNFTVLTRIEEMKFKYPKYFQLSPDLQSIQSQLLTYNQAAPSINDNIS